MRAASLVFIVSLLFAAAAVASASASNAIAFRGGKAQSAKSDFSSALTAAVTPDFSFHADGLQWVRLDKVQSLNMNPMCSVQVLNKFLDSFDCAGPETFDKETAKKNYMKEVEQRAKDLKEDLDEKSLYAKKLSDDQDTQFAVKAVVWSVMSPLTFTLTFMLPGVGGTISGVLSKVVGFVVGIAFDTSIESISKFLQSDDKAFDKYLENRKFFDVKDSKGDIALLFVRKLRQDYLSVIEKQKGLEKKGDKVNVVEPPLLSKLLLVVRLFTKQVYESIKLAIVKKMYEVKDKVTSVGNKLSELKNKIANVYNGVKNKINEAYDAVSDWVAGKNKDAPPPKEVVEVAKQHKHPILDKISAKLQDPELFPGLIKKIPSLMDNADKCKNMGNIGIRVFEAFQKHNLWHVFGENDYELSFGWLEADGISHALGFFKDLINFYKEASEIYAIRDKRGQKLELLKLSNEEHVKDLKNAWSEARVPNVQLYFTSDLTSACKGFKAFLDNKTFHEKVSKVISLHSKLTTRNMHDLSMTSDDMKLADEAGTLASQVISALKQEIDDKKYGPMLEQTYALPVDVASIKQNLGFCN